MKRTTKNPQATMSNVDFGNLILTLLLYVVCDKAIE